MASPSTEECLSLEHIQASELYPKRPLVSDDEQLQVPFPVLHGESVEFLGRTSGGAIAMSNYRLFIRCKETFVNIPLGMVEGIEARDIFYLLIYGKDSHTHRCIFETNEACIEWFKRLKMALQPPARLQEVFAFAFHAWCKDSCPKGDAAEMSYQLCRMNDSSGGFSFDRELERLGFDLKRKLWRITLCNEDYRVCNSYPKLHIVPHNVTDGSIERVAEFRGSHRFPSVVWRDPRSGVVIARSSQPEVGWLGWRSEYDEQFLQAILDTCGRDLDNLRSEGTKGEGEGEEKESDKGERKLLIIDARSYAAAVANRAKGGGCECADYYPSCEIQFMNLANIHTIRKCFQAVRQLCALTPDQPTWLTLVESTKWLQNISALFRASLVVVNAVDHEKRPVLVHCSDGWDRTPQVVALAELLLDPYYRTLEGFRVLIEREWLEFGHKFADRCGQGVCMEDVNERCPIFLQWLDCVHQLLLQFPCEFQFNEACLVKLAHHTYSCLFGTFLCNTTRDRDQAQLKQQTTSVWTLLENQRAKFINRVFRPGQYQVLRPSHHMKDLRLWHAIYLSDCLPAPPAPTEPSDDPEASDIEALLDSPLVSKTRSCENIKAAVEAEGPTTAGQLPRTLSDTNLSRDMASVNGLLMDSVSSESKDSEVEEPPAASGAAAEEEEEPPQDEGMKHQLRPHESSTDTLTEDQQVEALRSSPASQGTLTNGLTNGHNTPAEGEDERSERLVHMSTSTSDLSDSRIGAKGACHPLGCSKLNEALLHLQIKPSKEAPSPASTNGYASSSNTSSSPPTPAADLRASLWGQNHVSRLIDLDGLTCHVDPVQQRLAHIEADYQQQLRQLERQLLMHKRVLHQYATAAAAAGGCNGCHLFEYEDMLSTESADSGEHASSTGASSDVSWEQVEEREAQITLWMPDHAVTHCAGCDSSFNLVRRKHHCRNCGQVFCHDCTNFTVPVPQQHLNTPVRVCHKCYETFGSHVLLTSNGFLENDAAPELC